MTAADDGVCDRNRHDSRNDHRQREVKGEFADHLPLRTAEHITHGITPFVGLGMVAAESDDGHDGHKDADDGESCQKLEDVPFLTYLVFEAALESADRADVVVVAF